MKNIKFQTNTGLSTGKTCSKKNVNPSNDTLQSIWKEIKNKGIRIEDFKERAIDYHILDKFGNTMGVDKETLYLFLHCYHNHLQLFNCENENHSLSEKDTDETLSDFYRSETELHGNPFSGKGFIKKCPLCGKKYLGYGNSPRPLDIEGQVCDDCNENVIIPYRLISFFSEHNKLGHLTESLI